jgi:nickel-dependent lactate racemase
MAHIVELPWGHDSLRVELPPSWRVLGELKPNADPPASDPAAACREALADPIGVTPIGGRNLAGRKVVVVTDDHSRPTPAAGFIRPVLEELAKAGVRDQDIDILIATGVHRASRMEEVEAKLGFEVMNRYRWRCHDAYKPEGLTDLGATRRGTRVFLNTLLPQADLIVGLGAIEPHLLLGFGGGLKIIIPGCAGAETIGRNHLQGVDPDRFDLVGARTSDSPMRQDLEEGALLLSKDIFVVNAILGPGNRPVRFFAGHPQAAHQAGVEYIRTRVRLDVPEQADVVLANSHPMDLDLRQSVKCLGNSLYAARPGGVLLGCVRCEDGLGEMPLAKKTLPYPVMRTLLKVIGKNRVLPLVKKVKKNEPVEEVFIGHFGLQMLRRNHLGIFSNSPKLPDNIGRKMGLARSFNQVEAMMAWAAGKAPKNASVWVFPHGGAGYASFGSN